ncbi:hypothetical protein BGW80DRAFT_1461436 [Lactifluus volemus]|nr:hypothetical protein BGW80DRAFT_1461436 [Lactifluus volemus]
MDDIIQIPPAVIPLAPPFEDPQVANHGQPQRPPYIHRPHYDYVHGHPPAPPAYQPDPYGPGFNMDIPPPVEHVAIPDQAQHIHYYAPLPQVLPAIPNDLGFEAYARPVQGVQPQAQPYGPQLGAYWPYQILPDARQAENLRRLAIHYLQNLESQVDTVRMEQSLTGRFKVVIVLDMDDFL